MIRPEPTLPYDQRSGLLRFLGVLASVPVVLGLADHQREFALQRGTSARVRRQNLGWRAFGMGLMFSAISGSTSIPADDPRPEEKASPPVVSKGEVNTAPEKTSGPETQPDSVYKLPFVRNSLSCRGRRGED